VCIGNWRFYLESGSRRFLNALMLLHREPISEGPRCGVIITPGSHLLDEMKPNFQQLPHVFGVKLSNSA